MDFRASLLELLIVAAAIGLGINLIAGALEGIFAVRWIGFLGVGLLVIGCAVLVGRLAPRVNRKLMIEGVLLFDKKNEKFLPIDQYRLAEKVSDYFKFLFHENKAIENTWKRAQTGFHGYSRANKAAEAELAGKRRLVIESIEYLVLNTLSSTLIDYFNESKEIDSKEIKSLERKDIPSVLLSNRFLELFSRPMEEREAFSNRDRKESDPTDGVETRIVSAYSGGAYFDYFELVLPAGSVVSRGEHHSINIKTGRFSLHVRTIFNGFMSVLPRGFEQLYIGESHERLAIYSVKLGVEMSLKPFY
jgi:hypothetical protein